MKRQNRNEQFKEWYFKALNITQQKMIIGKITIKGVEDQNDGTCRLIYNMNGEEKEGVLSIHNIKTNKYGMSWADNMITKDKVQLDIKERTLSIKGELGIEGIVDAKQSFIKPGIMGYYQYLPRLEFYQDILVLQGKIKGMLCINGEEVDLSGGSYYLQRQWGNKYPNVWLWTQCNGFKKKKNLALTVGIARLKLWFNYYTGFAVPIYYDNRVEVFSNYNGGHIAKLYRYKGYVHLIVTQKDKLLDLKIYGRDEIECILDKETHGIRDVYGCNKVKLEVKMTQNGKVILEDTSFDCNIEMGGNTSKLK